MNVANVAVAVLLLLHATNILDLTNDMRLFVFSTTVVRNTHNNWYTGKNKA
jgi:hypothetical protein